MTVKKIAELAGVSPAAVSLVLNNKKGVSDEKRQNILRIIKEHGYTVPQRSKPDSKSVYCLIKYASHGMITEENQGFIAAIIDRIQNDCHAHRINLVMMNCNSSNSDEVFRIASDNHYDGIIVIGSEIGSEQIESICSVKTPAVVVDNAMLHHNVDSVVMANEEIVYLALQHLKSLGHTEIGYFSSGVSISNFVQRRLGYFRAIHALNMKSVLEISLTPTLNGAYEDMKIALNRQTGRLPSAIFADNDTIAIGAIKALQEAGYSIPNDTSIIGIDDIPFSAISSPTLTTMRISRKQMGQASMMLLRYRIANPDAPPVHLTVLADLIIRSSTKKLSS